MSSPHVQPPELLPSADRTSSVFSGLIRLMRPRQWIKNLLVFAALLFSVSYSNNALVLRSVLAFVAMCLASSGTYALNDYADRDRDRNHPTKRWRPVASGAVPELMAVAIGIGLIGGGFAVAFAVNVNCSIILGIYLAIQVGYNLGLKRVAIADVFLIALGFLLRAILGAAAIQVTISGWFLICTVALALMLGFAKRRHEFILQGTDRSASRESLVSYSLPALDALVIVFAATAAVFYGIYVLQSDTAHRYPAIVLTAVFVAYGISRYLLLVFGQNEGGEPADIISRDPQLIACAVGFILVALLALSGYRVPYLS